MDHTNLDLMIPHELTAEEAAAVFGGANNRSTSRLKRQKKGVHNIRHRRVVKSTKRTQSRSSLSGANRFAF